MTVYELLSVVISFVAILLAYLTGLQNHNHNKKSVRPRLAIRFHLRGSKGNYGISVKNEGLGPALIKHFQIKNGTVIMEDVGDNGWQEVIRQFNLSDVKPGYEIISTNGVIPSGGIVWLLSTRVNEEYRVRLKNVVENIDIKIIYESIYAEKYVEYFRKR